MKTPTYPPPERRPRASWRLPLGLIAAGVLSMAGAALAQSQFTTPIGPQDPAQLVINGCLNATRQAVPCSDAGAIGADVRATQAGTWRTSANTGTPVASAVTSLGLASTSMFAAKTNRNWLVIQNQGSSGAIWCNPAGAAATAASPSIMILPGTSWSPGGGSGYVPSSAVTCIASVDLTPVAAWQSP